MCKRWSYLQRMYGLGNVLLVLFVFGGIISLIMFGTYRVFR